MLSAKSENKEQSNRYDYQNVSAYVNQLNYFVSAESTVSNNYKKFK
jgi:hypothetical protein